MPGRILTNQQVKLYMEKRRIGDTQIVAAAKSGISERSGRRIEQGRRTKPTNPRPWRTRIDPLSKVWDSLLVPLLEDKPELSPLTLLEYLQTREPSHYPDNLLRTLQRRIKNWKALHGPAKPVMFRQSHPPGQQGLSDFTQLKGLSITVNQQLFSHLLYHFRLAYSGWSYLKVICGGESFTALAEGLQEALWCLGGSPAEHRTDHLSAAFSHARQEGEPESLTQDYQALCEHYAMLPTTNNLGAKHENGSIESPHGHLKWRIQQALLLRGSSDFESVILYQDWLAGIVRLHNQRNAKLVLIERTHLTPLPAYKTIDFTQVVVRVSSASTVDVRRVTYTVPSRLEGEILRVHLYHDRLVCYIGAALVITLPRIYPVVGAK
jgi:hypothetical protein